MRRFHVSQSKLDQVSADAQEIDDGAMRSFPWIVVMSTPLILLPSCPTFTILLCEVCLSSLV